MIADAKQYSRKRGVSISRLIEDYLQGLVSSDKKTPQRESIADSLAGILEEPKTDYKLTKAKHLLRKHA